MQEEKKAMRSARSGKGKTWQERLEEARQRGFDRLQAIASAAGLLRELERYVARREHQGRHTTFDEMLDATLPGLALAIALLRGQNEAVESADVQARWGEISQELAEELRPLAATDRAWRSPIAWSRPSAEKWIASWPGGPMSEPTWWMASWSGPRRRGFAVSAAATLRCRRDWTPGAPFAATRR